MTEQETVTITQAADALGCSRATIYRLLENPAVAPFVVPETRGTRTVMVLQADALQILRDLVPAKRTEPAAAAADPSADLVAALQAQIADLIKSRTELENQLTDALQIAAREQVLHSTTAARLAQYEQRYGMLPEGTQEETKADPKQESSEEPVKRGFWARIFGR